MAKKWEVVVKADGKVVVSSDRVSFWAQVRGTTPKRMAERFIRQYGENGFPDTMEARALAC
jgi:predicted aconitase with swiveling domain